MDDKSYFVVAVIIAFAVPMIFGSVYFFRMRNLKDNTRYVTMLRDKPDLVLDGKCSIDSELNGSLENEISFSVQYVRGEEESVYYDLYFDDVELSNPNSVIRWSLYMFNEETDSYTVYNTGSIDGKSSKRVLFGDNIPTRFLKNQKFKLKYMAVENSGNIKFKSNIELEQE